MKTDPKYGYFSHWPEDGNEWIHPDDVEKARHMIPSERIFRRDGQQDDWVVMHYGDVQLRVRPALWQEVRPEGFEIGQCVEIRTRGMANPPQTGRIKEMVWDPRAGEIRYQIAVLDVPVPNHYAAADLKHVDPTPPLEEPGGEMAE